MTFPTAANVTNRLQYLTSRTSIYEKRVNNKEQLINVVYSYKLFKV